MSGFFFKLHSEDPIIAVATTGYDLDLSIPYLAALARGRVAHLLLSVNWHLPHQMEQLIECARRASAEAPNIRIVVMAPTEADDRACREAGIDSFYCNHNCLTNERLFRPDPAVEKRFDAVYVGRLAPMKRHELAFEVPRLAVVSAAYDVEPGYVGRLMAGFRDLAWSNYDADRGTVRLLDSAQIARILQASRCGLALSALEGAMFASTEYLLCGLPVVTTPSVGGRDVFFSPAFVATVAPDPVMVARAVAAFRANPPDPLAIRGATLAAFRPHRMRLLLRLSALMQRNLLPEADAMLWHPLMKDKMRAWLDPGR